MSMREYALQTDALPLTNTAMTYAGDSDEQWDALLIFGCKCDSSWTVGLTNGTTQVPEYYGPGCELRRCPSGDDPMTPLDETDCENRNDNGKTTACSNNNYYTSAACTTRGYWCTATKSCYTAVNCGGSPLATGGRQDSEALCTAPAGSWDATEYGASGNKCHVECSNRGKCDRSTGTCQCHVGWVGYNCNTSSVYGFGEVSADG